ncbi:phage portal protein [Parabacteroides distasonis]|nr:phage portal protein [Parabacteroides distasonis]
MGEVFFPVDFLASRIAGGNYQLKLAKDDSVVFNNEEMNRFFSDPNPLFSFEDLVKMFFVYKYVTGNGFWQASPSVGRIKPKELWKWCDTYWVLPSDQVVINSPMSIPLFQPSTKEDIINSYRISTSSGLMDIDPSLVIHYKDINMRLNSSYLKGRSRLETQRYPIANLVAVYEARNVIYVKRGALGLLISKKYDADGSLPLTDKEKRNIRKEWNDNYGLTNDRSQMSIVDVPTEFVRINMSIQDLCLSRRLWRTLYR